VEESKHYYNPVSVLYRPTESAKSTKVKLELALRSNQQAEVHHHLVEYSTTEHTDSHLLAIARSNFYSYPLSAPGVMAVSVAKCSPFPLFRSGFPGWLALGGTPMTGVHQSDRTGQGFWKSQRTGHGQLFLGRRTTYNCNFLTGSSTKVNPTCGHVVCACRNSLK
jgi:hypothetical protein